MDEVLALTLMAAPFNLLAYVGFFDMASLRRFITERLTLMDGVAAVDVWPVLRQLRRFGLNLLERQEQVGWRVADSSR
jgi:hypothetical protein